MSFSSGAYFGNHSTVRQCARAASAARVASARVDRAVVQDQHHRPQALRAGPWPVALVEDLEQCEEVGAALGPAGVDDEIATCPVEHAEQGHLGGLAGRRDAQVGPFLRPGVSQVGMRQRFRFVAKQQHNVARVGLRFQ